MAEARERGQGISRSVVHELAEDFGAQIAGDFSRQLRLVEDIDDRLHARGLLVARFSDHELVAADMDDHARAHDFVRRKNDAAERSFAQPFPELALRIEERQRTFVAGQTLVPPPHEAVQREQHGTLRREHLLHGRSDRRHGMRLQRDDHEVLLRHLLRIVRGQRRFAAHFLVARFQRNAVLPDRVEMSAAGDHRHFGSLSRRHARSDMTADGARSKNTYLHASLLV
jgi:hypothetical protein